jgi:RING-variant domain
MNAENKPSAIPGSWEWPDDVPRQRRTQEHPASASHAEPQDSTARPTRTSQSNGTSQPGASASSNQSRRHWGPRTCRICLETVLPTFHPPSENLPGFLQPGPRVTYDSEGGRLIRPCKCKGSVKYVHEDCLQHWRHADPAYGARNYYHCPTCGFKYKLSRLGWGNLITSVGKKIRRSLNGSQLTLLQQPLKSP